MSLVGFFHQLKNPIPKSNGPIFTELLVEYYVICNKHLVITVKKVAAVKRNK